MRIRFIYFCYIFPSTGCDCDFYLGQLMLVMKYDGIFAAFYIFLGGYAETYSEKIINVSPEGIVTVGKKLKVKQINKAACKIFGIKDPADIIGYPVSRIMDEYDFVKMISQDETQVTDEVFLADYNVYLERIFICDPERTLFTCIMRDVTKARQRRNKIQKTKIHAADLADDIIANQLRIVHEIASLLGETAAETKVAVHDLKEAIMLDEDGDDDA